VSSASARWPRVASLRTPAGLRTRLAELDLELPCDDLVDPTGPLAAPLDLGGVRAPNRFAIQPMEGWDGTPDGRPTPLTERRWRRFGASGAGWLWGGEAVAVRPEGRANPHQLVMGDGSAKAIGALRRAALASAAESGAPAPVVGLQLTHSGRWSVPERGNRRPRVAYRHPLLDARSGVAGDDAVLGDAELGQLVRDFASAARLAAEEGFDFVDVKHCHGYLLHELLSARTRGGRYGGETLAARSRFALEVVAAVRDAAPGLRIGVRLSVFDAVPHQRVEGERGPEAAPLPHPRPYPFAFGADPSEPTRLDLAEPIAFARALQRAGVTWWNVTAASPYYAPHLQRPALFPPSDGYPPPEDPLVGVARLLGAARELKRALPGAVVVSSGWSYLQDFVPHVAQPCLAAGWFDAVGLGRMALSYPDLPRDVLAGRPLERRRVCRTFSDCTSAPRAGLVSGCYPLDAFYRERPEHAQLEARKRAS
jgi:2,4-dienoyl-CoA reductase-like NADH-dependent reductase (Old Yellow Enzyme family)